MGAAKKELHKTKYRRLNLGMMASASALLAVRAAHADLQTPVADILTVLQAGLTGIISYSPCRLTVNKKCCMDTEQVCQTGVIHGHQEVGHLPDFVLS